MSANLTALLRHVAHHPERQLVGSFNSYGTRPWQFNGAPLVVVTANFGGTSSIAHEPDFIRYAGGTDSPAWACPASPDRPNQAWHVSCRIMDDVI